MLFAVTAFLRPGAEDELINHSDEFNEHLGPSAMPDERARKNGPSQFSTGPKRCFEGAAVKQPIAKRSMRR